MKKPFFSRRCFTLIELMISIAITVLLILFFTQVIDTLTLSIKLNTRRTNTASLASFIFNRIKQDISNMPKRLDTDYLFTNTDNGSDFIRCISQVKGIEGDREVSLVAYKIEQDNKGIWGLYRGAHGYQWNDLGYMGVDKKGEVPRLTSLPSNLNLQNNDYELLAPGVFRVALAFQYKSNGAISNTPPLYSFSTNSSQKIVQITNIASVIVCIAMINPKNSMTLSSEQNQILVSKMTEIPEGILPLAHWNTNLEHQFRAFSTDLPLQAAQSVKVYQQFFPLE